MISSTSTLTHLSTPFSINTWGLIPSDGFPRAYCLWSEWDPQEAKGEHDKAEPNEVEAGSAVDPVGGGLVLTVAEENLGFIEERSDRGRFSSRDVAQAMVDDPGPQHLTVHFDRCDCRRGGRCGLQLNPPMEECLTVQQDRLVLGENELIDRRCHSPARSA